MDINVSDMYILQLETSVSNKKISHLGMHPYQFDHPRHFENENQVQTFLEEPEACKQLRDRGQVALIAPNTIGWWEKGKNKTIATAPKFS